MEDYFSRYNPLFKKDIIHIYHSWININKSLYMKYYNLIALILMSLLIPFDFILYENNNIYTEGRVVYIIIILINFVYIQQFQKKIFIKDSNYKIQHTLLLPAFFFNALYIYYMLITPDENFSIILLANFITIITTTMFAMKFWKEQYMLNIGSIIIILPFIQYNILGCIYIILFHILSFVAAFVYRRRFIMSMYEKYCNMASLVPRNVAMHIAMTEGVIELEKIFKPTNRFTVCLSSDWRDFQQLASTEEPEYIENIFQKFYNEVFEELDRLFPEGNYYADWTADELFIIFFTDDNNDNDLLMKNAMEFSYIYATDVFKRINAAIDTKLLYDIGMSAGIGLLGLQGPEKLKKTTITGENAGTAKRLETEAKNIRNTKDSKFPILIIDNILYDIAKSMNIFKDSFSGIIAKTKDIKDNKFHIWFNN